MAKIDRAINKISGKLGGEHVFVNSKAYGHHVRQSPKAGTKKPEAALQKQQEHSQLANGLASELHQGIKKFSGILHSGDFYRRILGKLMKDPVDSRWLLLNRLKGMEIHTRHQLQKLGVHKLLTRMDEQALEVTIQVEAHPEVWVGGQPDNCYRMKLLLLSWDNSADPPELAHKKTDWIGLGTGLPEFEFHFPVKEGTSHWLLCLGLVMGRDNKAQGLMPGMGMRIVAIGSFDEAERVQLEKLNAEALAKKERDAKKEEEEEGEVVRAKRVG